MAGLPKKYAKLGFKKGWAAYKKTPAYKKKKKSTTKVRVKKKTVKKKYKKHSTKVHITKKSRRNPPNKNSINFIFDNPLKNIGEITDVSYIGAKDGVHYTHKMNPGVFGLMPKNGTNLILHDTKGKLKFTRRGLVDGQE